MTSAAIRKLTLSRRTVLGGTAGVILAALGGSRARAATAFKEPLLKLFVISELMRLKRMDLGGVDAFHARLLGRPHDARIDGYRANPKALEYFAGLELSADALAAVEQLDLDGGNPIFKYVDPNWAGYTSGIEDLTRLEDIALLPNLMRFSNTAFLKEGARISFAPFRGLAELQSIEASFGEYADLDAFLDLPALKTCRLLGNRVYTDVMADGHPTRRTMQSLKSRGVKVLVQWISLSGPPFR
jgi:hypothetical protein